MVRCHPRLRKSDNNNNNNKQQKLTHQIDQLTSSQFVNQLSTLYVNLCCWLHHYKTKQFKATNPRDHQSTPAGSSEVLVGRDQLTDLNSQPVDASNQMPSTSNQLLSANREEELS